MIGPKTSALVAALGATLILPWLEAVAPSRPLPQETVRPVRRSRARGAQRTRPPRGPAQDRPGSACPLRPSRRLTLASVWTGPQMKLPGLYSVTSGEPHSRHLIV